MRVAFVGDSLTAGVPGSSYLAALHQRLPGHTLVNLGWPNDTVISLRRRIARHRFVEPVDLAFLWVGINDVGRHASWFHAVYSILRRRRRARHLDEFRDCYRETLAFLGRVAGRVIAVAPLLKGEDLGLCPGGRGVGAGRWAGRVPGPAAGLCRAAGRTTPLRLPAARPALCHRRCADPAHRRAGGPPIP
jgi:hypothetical protein